MVFSTNEKLQFICSVLKDLKPSVDDISGFFFFFEHSTLTDKILDNKIKQEGHDGPVSLYWLIREIHSYQTLHYLGIGLKHKTPYKD